MNQMKIPLTGLNCMGCARKVERQIHADHQATIDQLSPTSVTLNSDASFKQIATSVESLGYQAGYHYQFTLTGLSCGGCVNKLTQLLEQQAEIGQFEVSKTSLSLYTLLSVEEIQQLVASLGYQAQLAAEQDSDTVSADESAQPAEAQAKQQEQHAAEAKKSASETVDEQQAQASDSPEAAEPSNPNAIHLLIGGMTCASCVSSVEKALQSVDSVSRAQVNLAEQSALVFTDQPSPQVIDALVASVQQAGYQAEVIEDLSTQQQRQLQQQQEQQQHHKRSAAMGIVIGVPLMAWGVFGGNMMIHTPQDQYIWGTIGLICLWLLATAGRSFFSNAWQALQHRRATMDTLVALGTGAAWLFSMLVVLFPQWFPLASRHVYFEASAMIIGLISLGHYIEAKAKAKTTRSLQALINLQPQQATLVSDQGDKVIAVEAIQQGWKLRIKPGEKIPVDGKVLEGESYIDESMLTGEPIPSFKQRDNDVSAGTLNQDGSLVIEATGVGSNTMLSRIINMVRQAQSSKPAMARLADQISAVFVPVVVAIAIFSALVWYSVGPDPKASYMLVVATTVLIIACPCALGLATPLSVTVGIGKAAELGILIKDADVLQSASQVDTVVFDKTGTLTEGQPKVQQVFTVEGETDQLLQLAYSAERQSEHPLAKAICQYAEQQDISSKTISQFKNLQGKGVSGQVDGQSMLVSSVKYLKQSGVDVSQGQAALDECTQKAWTPVAVSLNEQLLGIIAIADPIKADAKTAVEALKRQHITPVMLTGDNQAVANAIAQELGIEQVIAEVLPDEKAKHIEELQQQGRKVAMIGDGVNDAPALALADIGIAMGSGSDVAIESAQMTVLNSSPVAVAKAIELSKATVKNMKQNLLGAFVYNTLGIPIAAGVLYPLFGFLLSPVVAGAAMALSSITVVSNANRLRLFKTTIHS
ncbi:copper-translocating P-type ATPase [Vibrio sp.]|uniref:heavy metal translocating P-type ATPase n=1 Tax=Vibrio sp. TaxID=678 RepID=UPI003D0F7629